MPQLRKLIPSLNGLYAFEAAVRCGSFARAADDLFLTAPAISRSIGRLEDHLGFKLFDRQPTGVELTAQGSLLYETLKSSFDAIAETVLVARKSDAKSRVVTFSVTTAFVNHWFVPRLSHFKAQFPQVEPRFETIEGVLAGPLGNADIAMRFNPTLAPNEVAQKLAPELILPVRAPAMANDAVLNDGQTTTSADNRLLTLERAHISWKDLASTQVIASSQSFSSSDYAIIMQAAMMGEGIAPGWINVVSCLMVSKKLVPAAASSLVTGRDCCLVRRLREEDDVIVQICDWIAEMLHEDIAILDQMYPHLALANLIVPAAAAASGGLHGVAGNGPQGLHRHSAVN